MALLEIENLSVSFPQEEKRFTAVKGISLSVDAGETHCLVGESGCGKSVTSMAILNLILEPGTIDTGTIRFNGESLLDKSPEAMRRLRGNSIAMIFQDPMNSLNPVYRCGEQVAEAIRLHRKLSPQAAMKEAVKLFHQVKIPDPEKRVKQYPHELSGGMRQRVMIAMALACEPKLLIADEPTTALDVTVQAQILSLIAELQKKYKMAVLFITHDLGVVAQIADRVSVLYAGNVVESGFVKEIFSAPKHPYTIGLMGAIPQIGKEESSLTAIKGTVPEPGTEIDGCYFYDRCPNRKEQCKEAAPQTEGDVTHSYACFYPGGLDVAGS